MRQRYRSSGGPTQAARRRGGWPPEATDTAVATIIRMREIRRLSRFTALAGTVAAVGGLVLILAAELLHLRASRRLLGPARPPHPGGTDAVVVLGCPAAADGSATALQRWRCRIAARSLDPARAGVLIFTGGAVHGPWTEARVMAAYTVDHLGIAPERVRTEVHAENTWQNIEFTIPEFESADRVMIASQPMHAARARRYLRRQRPDLAARLTRADDYRPFECWWFKVPTALYELGATGRRRAGAALMSLIGPQRLAPPEAEADAVRNRLRGA